MGFFASAAKTAANKDVWAANAQAVASYKAMEAEVARMSGAAGVEWTVIRAGTLKGGGGRGARARMATSGRWAA